MQRRPGKHSDDPRKDGTEFNVLRQTLVTVIIGFKMRDLQCNSHKQIAYRRQMRITE